MLVEIWSDIACPWCYVGKRRFEAALAGFAHRDAVTVTWRSFELDPRAPRQHDVSQPELLARKYGMSVADAQAMNARMTEAAAGEGLAFRLDDVKVGNTFDAHRLLHFADTFGKREVLGERLFAAYLGEGAALGDIEALVALAGDVGLDPEAVRAVLSGEEYATAVREDEADAQEIGVTGVPFFVLDRRYGISGAQGHEVLRGALEQAWTERTP
ncbi:DsbA family oxidoreductase [Gemmatimonas groenlandica]|uniref:DsbA family oxidoreductase n=1 Tax=Gemmatimonas groenlandica TaxID=2732249 RepID=A0A6M4IPL3_9BACT|nr:DsbA family oxidoreductase [Gemmatimonas groenlandica]QJR35376.1 DsbA family oxidoreductase [Gemmatimonas groenlandica]